MGLFNKKSSESRLQELETPAEHIVQLQHEPCFGQGGIRGFSNGSLEFFSSAGTIDLGSGIRSWNPGHPFMPFLGNKANLGFVTSSWVGISIPEEFVSAWIYWLQKHYPKN